ncbi:MAG: hypothetical protein R3219_09440, partial [Hydrogenovibrio sp.]|nr:hypothetical protein [Hydrogenovibrio sp.]
STLVEDEGVMVKDRSQIRFSGLAAKEGGEFEGLDWEVFLAQLRQEVTQLAQSLQQGKAAAVYESEEDLRFAGSLLALRLPEVKRQSQSAVSD